MEMKPVRSGKLRAIGYAPRERLLRVELEDGRALEYAGVGDEIWRRLASSSAPWSYYRDVVEEEFSARESRAMPHTPGANPLDDLFRK